MIVYENDKYQVHTTDTDSLYLHQPQPEYTAILALHEGQVVIAHQTRVAVGGLTYEIPGGGLHPGEDPADGARRELREETGLICGDLIPLGSCYNYACMMNRRTHFFFTDQILSVESQDLDEDEDVRVLRFPVAELFTRIADGRIAEPELSHGLLLARLKGLI